MRRLAFYLIVALLLACSKQSPTTGPNNNNKGPRKLSEEYKLADKFSVGSNVVVRALSMDQQGQLWVGTSVGAMLIRLEDQEVINRYTRKNGLANEYIFAAMVDAQQNVWLGSNGGGASRLDSASKWQTYFPMHGLADYWVYCFAQRKNGEVWIGTWNGISVLREGKFSNYLKELVNEWVYGMAVDSKDRVWIGTEGGVNMFDGEQWHVWTHKEGIGVKNKNNLPASDNTGLGTRDRHNLSTMLDGKSTYNPNYIFSVLVDKQDKVWVGTWGGGVSVFGGKSWHNYSDKQGLFGSIVYSLAYEKKNNRIWAGTNKGLYFLKENKWHNVLQEKHIYAVSVDNNKGEVWAGGLETVYRFAKTPNKGGK